MHLSLSLMLLLILLFFPFSVFGVWEAEFLGIPYVEPYLGYKNGAVPRGSIEQGVNFAVAGATALGRSFFEEKGFAVDVTTNYSLVVQLGWFKDVLRSLCTSPSSKVTLSFRSSPFAFAPFSRLLRSSYDFS